MSEVQQRWVVGVDLRPESEGAVRFGAWLAEGGGAQLLGVHVVENDALQFALRHRNRDEVVAGAEAAMRSTVDALGTPDVFAELRTVEGNAAEDTLADAVIAERASGLIVGRHAGCKRKTIVRLGRVARRLLRHAEVPVVVVPPDLKSLGHGPVVIATDLQENCARAAVIGLQLAKQLGRPALVVHVVSSPEDYGSHYLPEGSLEEIHAEHQQSGESELDAWLAKYGLTGVDRLVLQGSAVENLIELTDERDVAMVVMGSRKLSGMERLFLTSIGTELAASATCPVAVVPPVDAS